MAPVAQRPAASNNSNETFPKRLYAMLQEAESQGFSSIVRWVDDRYFRVFDPDRFEAEVLGRYFESTKFNSFRRQLNLYGFECIREKRHRRRGCYSHPRFRRDCPPDSNLVLAKKQTKKKPLLEPFLEFPLSGSTSYDPSGGHWLPPGDLWTEDIPVDHFDAESPLSSLEQEPATEQQYVPVRPDAEKGFVQQEELLSSNGAGSHGFVNDRIFAEWLGKVPLDIQDEILSTFLQESNKVD